MLSRFLAAALLLSAPAWADCKAALDAYAQKDYTTALAAFKAVQTEACAQYGLGVMSQRGLGMTADVNEALKWYRMAADQKYALAQFNLGVMYANGIGVQQDFMEALKWYGLAADQNLAVAEYNLGVMHAQGRGTPADTKEAAKWYRLSAEQGDADSQYALAYLYEFGDGVPQDPTQAYLWYSLVASRFKNAQVAITGRDNVAKKLTPAQIADLDAQVKAWKPKPASQEPAK
jgi:TPR repeat protein